MSQIENNSNNINMNMNNNVNNSTNNNNNNNNTTHFRARNINLSFIKELFKKNAILYIALIFAIPVIGLLFIILYDGEESYYRANPICDFNELLPFTVLIIATIPAILSITLFSWVFKRKKVDFICSMPINRRTMCLSATLLGVAIIIIISLLYILGLGLGSIVSAKHFFAKQLLDTFIYIVLAMLFLFGICNLAMSRAGNLVTQAILILLLLLFIPLSVLICREMGRARIHYFEGYSQYEYLYDQANGTDYLPIPLNSVFGEKTTALSTNKIVQSLAYIAVIYILAQVLFEHRKMEENQESFKNVLVHEIVKVLTMLIPMSAIVYGIFDGNIEIPLILIFIIISIVYVILYDLITSKKVKIKYSIITIASVYLISIILGFSLYKVDEVSQKGNRNLSVNSINAIYIKVPCGEEWYEIGDADCINAFLKYKYSKDSSYDYSQSLTEKYDEWNNDSDETEKYAGAQEEQNTTSLSVLIKLKNNRKYRLSYTTISEDAYNKIFNNYLEDIKTKAIDDIRTKSAFWTKKYENPRFKTHDYVGLKSQECDLYEIIDIMKNKSTFELYLDSNPSSDNIFDYHYRGFLYNDFMVNDLNFCN